MKSIILFTGLFLSSISFAGVSSGEAAARLPGFYKAYLQGGGVNAKIAFAVGKNLQTKVVSSDPEYMTVGLKVDSFSETEGPDALPLASFWFAAGSDEETLSYVVRVWFEKEFNSTSRKYYVRLKLMDAVVTFNDGPNDVSSAGRATVKLFKKHPQSGKYFPIN